MMNKKLFLVQFFFILNFCVGLIISEPTCMDENNQAIDWFIGLKFPGSFNFLYISSKNNQWTQPKSNLSSANNLVALTLRQSYNPQFFYAYYNDEKPMQSQRSAERGHLKGVLNFGKSSGYWLIHSVPKFPTEGSYNYRTGEETFAQSFICVTVTSKYLGPFVDQLLMMQSTVYSYNLPENFSQDQTLMKNLNKFVRNRMSNSTKSNVFKFTTLGQQSFIHLGKSGSFGNDLYAGLIAPTLKVGIYVESWIRGERLHSSCQAQYKVFDVTEVSLEQSQFKETQDHSKWAVSNSQNQPFVCIGDINRMRSQFKRGGGSLCLSDVRVWNTFHTVVSSYEKCP